MNTQATTSSTFSNTSTKRAAPTSEPVGRRTRSRGGTPVATTSAAAACNTDIQPAAVTAPGPTVNDVPGWLRQRIAELADQIGVVAALKPFRLFEFVDRRCIAQWKHSFSLTNR